MLQQLCPYRHAYLSNYPVIGRQSVLLCFLNNLSCIRKISHIHEFLLISCILRIYSLSNNLLYILNCTFSYNKFIYLFVLLLYLYLFRNVLSYHRTLSLPKLHYGQYEILIFRGLNSIHGTGSLYSFEVKVLRVLLQLESPKSEHRNSRYVLNNRDYSMLKTEPEIGLNIAPLWVTFWAKWVRI